MAARKPGGDKKPRQVRKSVAVDAEKLAKARKAFGLASDAEVLRFALDHLVEHLRGHHAEEE